MHTPTPTHTHTHTHTEIKMLASVTNIPLVSCCLVEPCQIHAFISHPWHQAWRKRSTATRLQHLFPCHSRWTETVLPLQHPQSIYKEWVTSTPADLCHSITTDMAFFTQKSAVSGTTYTPQIRPKSPHMVNICQLWPTTSLDSLPRVRLTTTRWWLTARL